MARRPFFLEGLTHARELEYASSQLTSIEINGTYYGSQKPASFASGMTRRPTISSSPSRPRASPPTAACWPRPALDRRFFNSGVTELKAKLGPINWQFATTKQFDPDDFAAFLRLLPAPASKVEKSATLSKSATKSFARSRVRRPRPRARRRGRLRRRRRVSADRRPDRAVRLRPHHGHRGGRAGAWLPRRKKPRPLGGPRENQGGRRRAERVLRNGRRSRSQEAADATFFSMSSAARRKETRRPRWR